MGMNLNLMKEIKNKIKNNVFIETGTCQGECVTFAILSGYNLIKSVEFQKDRYEQNLSYFSNNSNVSLFNGKSEEKLETMLNDIQESCTFWLDAHNDYSCPIIHELEIIKSHSKKHNIVHTIIIDDIRMFDTPIHENIKHEDLKNKILEINSNYNFYYADSNHATNDLLIASTEANLDSNLIKSEYKGTIVF